MNRQVQILLIFWNIFAWNSELVCVFIFWYRRKRNGSTFIIQIHTLIEVSSINIETQAIYTIDWYSVYEIFKCTHIHPSTIPEHTHARPATVFDELKTRFDTIYSCKTLDLDVILQCCVLINFNGLNQCCFLQY